MYVCFYWVLSHMCKVCFFFSLTRAWLHVCCFFFFCNSEAHVCTQNLHTFFFLPRAWRHFLVPPSAQTLSLFLWRFFFFFFFFLSSVQQFTGSGFDSPFYFFVYSEFITQIFFLPSFLPDSQAAAVPNSLALHFFKATFKKTSWSHAAHLWNHAREVKGKKKKNM